MTAVYSLQYIREMKSNIKDLLDEDTQRNLRELREYSKFVNQFKAPIRIRHKVREETPIDQLRTDILSHLNKITDANFFSMSTKISHLVRDSPLDRPTILQMIIDVLFEKSCNESLYTHLYGRLVNVMVADWAEFRDMLVAHCERYIDEYLKQNTVSVHSASDVNYDQMCAVISTKSKFIGAYVFIGTLYINGIVTREMFMSNYESLVYYVNKAPPEYLEKYVDGLCSLLSLVHGKLAKDLGWDNFKSDIVDEVERLKNDKARMKGKMRFKLVDCYEKLVMTPEDIEDGWKRV